ncbi:MAG: L-threonylcarbamoyladenylate synthase [Patescibacteria group bacterium]
MQLFEDIWNDKNLINALQRNDVVIMPTDTLYGLVGKALNSSTVERIYNLKKRALKKPCIILIGNVNQLEKFSIVLSEEQKSTLQKYWSFDFTQDLRPSPTSIVLDCPGKSLSYLHRGTKTLAFRVPSPETLRNLLLKVGPLIAPSANPDGLPPAQNISEAQKYFGDLVDLYIDGGEINNKHSKLIKLHKDGSISILRE